MKGKIAAFLPWILVLISLFVALRNYTPVTFLSGWDTLHPEFDFGLNFSRVFNGVFRDEQGLGAVAGHSHMSEIPRIIELYILSFVFPKELLRYISILSALIIGPLGVYFFVLKLTKDRLTSFFGGIFYLLNLGTLQQFIVPFEMFTTQYAFLPWLFLSVLNFLENGRRKDLIILTLITFLASPMAYAATLWYAYFLSLIFFLLIYYLLNKNGQILNRSLKILLFTFLINLYWILPNIYFVINHAKEVSESKINTLFTEEAFAQNVSFGNIKDIALFKGFLFNWGVYFGDNKFGQLLEVWQKHLENPYATFLGFLFFAIVVIGAVSEVLRKNKTALAILSVFLLSFFFLLNINPPFGFIFRFIQENIPLFREAIRFPFTKFSILLIFSSSVFFAYGISYLMSLSQLRIKYAPILFLLFTTFALSYYMWPSFNGNLVSPFMKVKIPSEYFQLFDYFKKEPQGRIAHLPIHSFWGWEYYKWYEGQPSYQGAGFIWFGLKQPILHRDFDRWTKENEEYYREMSYAIYTKDSNLFSLTLKKFDISYIILDRNIIAPGLSPNVLYFDEIESLIKENSNISKANQFGNILVYKLPSNNKTYTVEKAKIVSPKFLASYEDFAYQKFGTYQSPKDTESSIYFPFRNIIDNQHKFLKDTVSLSQDGISLSISRLKNVDFKLPPFEELEKVVSAGLFIERSEDLLKITIVPQFPKSSIPLVASTKLPVGQRNFLLSVNQKSFILNNPAPSTPIFLGNVFLNTASKNTISLYEDRDDLAVSPNFSSLNFSLDSCEEKEKGTLTVNPNGNNLELSAKNSQLCLVLPLQNLIPDFEKVPGEEILLRTKLNPSGNTIASFCLANLTNKVCNSYGIRSDDSIFFPIKKGEIRLIGLKVFIGESQENVSVSLKDVSLGLRKPLFIASFGKEVLSLSLDFLKEVKEADLKIAFAGKEDYSLDITKLPKGGGDCETNPGPQAPTKQIVKKEEDRFIRYTAQNGSFCDHFSFPNLSQNQSYAIIIESRNVKGLPIRLCVANSDSKRCDLYAHLANSRQFSKDIFLLPPMKRVNEGTGYDININNLGVKGIPSINDISSLYIIPFPYNWLSNIETKENAQSNYPTFVLSNSFENGFKAYAVDNKNAVSSLFPFLFGRELKDHVLVNNWANGWALDSAAPNSLYIVYLPQYLEYLGFLILLAIPIYLLKQSSRPSV